MHSILLLLGQLLLRQLLLDQLLLRQLLSQGDHLCGHCKQKGINKYPTAASVADPDPGYSIQDPVPF